MKTKQELIRGFREVDRDVWLSHQLNQVEWDPKIEKETSLGDEEYAVEWFNGDERVSLVIYPPYVNTNFYKDKSYKAEYYIP